MNHSALLLHRDSPFPVTQIGRLLAFHFDLHPTDAIAQARYCGGIVIERAPHAQILEAQKRLTEIGVETRCVPSASFGTLPRGFRAVTLEFRPEGLVAGKVGGSQHLIPRESIPAFHLHALLDQEQRPNSDRSLDQEMKARQSERHLVARSVFDAPLLSDEKPERSNGLSPRGQNLLNQLEERDLNDARFGLAIYTTEAFGVVRLEKDAFNYSCLGQQKLSHSMDNFLLLLDNLIAYLPEAWNREQAVAFSRSLDPRLIYREKTEELTNIDRWMLQWVRIDHEDSEEPMKGHASREEIA